ncbi:MAG TPA: hypothetical protein PLF40_19805 [Kofleriaceae bacterium]|nr:hypothetical protein [Kofleriaceae bacterium]
MTRSFFWSTTCLVAVGVVTACQTDPSLQVTVNADPEFDRKGREVETRVDVYETEAVTCEQLEFGEVTRDQLAAFRVTKDSDNPLTLSDISRTGGKLLVARQSVAGELAMIGCAQVSEISEDTKVTIDTHRLARVGYTNQSVTDTQTIQLKVRVTVADIDNRPIVGRALRWRAYAPVGATFPENGYTPVPNAEGEFVFVPVNGNDAQTDAYGEVLHGFSPPDKVGPYGAAPKISWADVQPRMLTDFAEAQIRVLNREPQDRVTQCVVNREGTRDAVYCLSEVTGTTVLRKAGLAPDLTPVVVAVQLPTFVGAEVPQALAVNSSTNEVFVIGSHGRYGVAGSAAVASKCVVPGGCLAGATLMQVSSAPACGNDGAAIIARYLVPAQIQPPQAAEAQISRTPFGGVSTKLPHGSLHDVRGGACVVATDSGTETVRQAVLTVLTGALGRQNGSYFLIAGDLAPTAVSPVVGIGFLEGPRPQLLYSSLDVTGTIVNQAIATVVNSQRRTAVEGEVSAIALPSQLLSSKVDADANYDMMMLYFGERVTLQITSARTGSGEDLSAAFTFNTTTNGGEGLLGDFDGDGVRDLLLYKPNSFASLTVTLLGKRAL